MGMTAAKQAKAAGLKGLQQVADMTGRSRGTLNNYHKLFPKLFEVILLGCKKILEKGEGKK